MCIALFPGFNVFCKRVWYCLILKHFYWGVLSYEIRYCTRMYGAYPPRDHKPDPSLNQQTAIKKQDPGHPEDTLMAAVPLGCCSPLPINWSETYSPSPLQRTCHGTEPDNPLTPNRQPHDSSIKGALVRLLPSCVEIHINLPAHTFCGQTMTLTSRP